MEIGALALTGVNTIICLVTLYYVARPKIIKIEEKSSDTPVKRAIVTPSGTLVVEEKRDVVVNSDEALWESEN